MTGFRQTGAPQTTKVTKRLRPFKVEHRKCQLEPNESPDQKSYKPPKCGCDHACTDHTVGITCWHHSRAHGFIGVFVAPK
jgi:hypothetical protein